MSKYREPKLPCLDKMEFLSDLSDPRSLLLPNAIKKKTKNPKWSVYVVHDYSWDTYNSTPDKNILIAFHRWNGKFRILARGISRQQAVNITNGNG